MKDTPRPKLGGPWKVTMKTRTLLGHLFESGKLLTLKEGQRLVQSINGINVHVRIILKYLRQEGVKAYI